MLSSEGLPRPVVRPATITRRFQKFLLVGATAVAVGTGSFINPRAVVEVADGLERYLAAQGAGSPAELPALFKAER